MTMRFYLSILSFMILGAGCSRPEQLTEEVARSVIHSEMPKNEPAYAEVPEKVWFGPSAPKDDYDELAIRTLRNLEREGLVTVTESQEPDGTTVFLAKVTKKGFPILGTMPSARGRALRVKICEKVFDGLRNFIRHPSQPTVGRGELVWHYAKPTPYYDLFETKINKPLDKPFASVISFYWAKGAWRFHVVVNKTEPSA